MLVEAEEVEGFFVSPGDGAPEVVVRTFYVEAGKLTSHDTYSGREYPWWGGAKEYRVPGRPETDRRFTLP